MSGPAGRHDAARAAVSALVVVVVHEDHGVHAVSHAPVVVRDAAETVEVPAPDTLRQLDTPPALELQTKVREDITITEKAPTRHHADPTNCLSLMIFASVSQFYV